MGDQVGHLPAKLMVKLAPYIDRGDIGLEGVINGDKGVCNASCTRFQWLSDEHFSSTMTVRFVSTSLVLLSPWLGLNWNRN